MEKLKEEFKKHFFWWWILVIIVIIFFYNLFFNDTEEYSYCIDDCVYGNNDCIYRNLEYNQIYTPQATSYMWGDKVEECSNDLESCVDDCKSNYG